MAYVAAVQAYGADPEDVAESGGMPSPDPVAPESVHVAGVASEITRNWLTGLEVSPRGSSSPVLKLHGVHVPTVDNFVAGSDISISVVDKDVIISNTGGGGGGGSSEVDSGTLVSAASGFDITIPIDLFCFNIEIFVPIPASGGCRPQVHLNNDTSTNFKRRNWITHGTTFSQFNTDATPWTTTRGIDDVVGVPQRITLEVMQTGTAPAMLSSRNDHPPNAILFGTAYYAPSTPAKISVVNITANSANANFPAATWWRLLRR